MNRRSVVASAVVMLTLLGCSDDGTFNPQQVGDDVRITVVGSVVTVADLAPVADASVWIDLGTPQGGEARASARTDESGRFTMQFIELDCRLATELAFRVFARKKGFTDAERTAAGNGGQPVIRCTSQEQVIDLHLGEG